MSMSVHGQDLRLCLSNALKLLSEISVSFLQQHPVFSVSIFSLFLLYITFPFVFWVLVYSIPLVVCTVILLSITFNANQHRDEGNLNQTEPDSTDGKKKKTISRVQSVRRRRAKEFAKERDNSRTQRESEEENNTQRESEEENNTLNHDPVVDRSNDIIIISSSNSKGAMQANEEEDHHKNKMDAAISDSERTKRLESLIARRRSRKQISLEFRKALMNNKERNQISSVAKQKTNMGRIVIPSSHNVDGGGPLSPVPGSAPPVLIPMKNPFDLPYDPHEEKPDLTGDSFEQEFMVPKSRDMMMFSRHQSFSSGPFSHNRNLKDASFDKGLSPINENENQKEVQTRATPQEEDTSSDEDVPVFKIDREAILKSLSMARGRNPNPLQEENENTDNNNDQLEEHLRRLKDGGYYTDKTRNRHSSYSIASDLQVEVSEISSPPLTIGENSSYLDNDEDDVDSWAGSSQIDLSQVDEYESRPGFSRSENEMPDNTTILNENHCDHPWCSIAEYPDSCRTTRSMSLDDKIDKTLQRSISLLTQTSGRYYSLKPEACSHRFKSEELKLNTLEPVEESATIETTDDEMEQIAAQSMMIPEDSAERLQPENQEMVTESSAIEDQLYHGSPQESEGEQISGEGTGLMANVAFEQVQISPTPKSVLEESLEPSNTSASEADEAESTKQHKICENGVKPEELACDSAQVPSCDEAQEDPIEETNSVNFNMDDEVSSSKENLTTSTQSADHLNDSIPPLSTAEELSKHQEIPTGESTQDDNIDKSTSYEVQTEASALHEEKGNGEHNLNDPKDQGQENSTSDFLDGTRDEVSNSVVERTTTFEVSGAVEDSVSTESYNKNEEDRISQQQHPSHESMPIPQDRQVANDTLTEDTK